MGQKSNIKLRVFLITATSRLLLLLIAAAICGCAKPSAPPPEIGVGYWSASGIGGPIKVRRLPPSDRVEADFQQWLDSESTKVARVYEARLCGASNQLKFTLEVREANTPVGKTDHTHVSFIYKEPTNGSYEFFWYRLGRHNADFLKIGDKPKRVWVEFNRQASKEGLPALEIVAFEGVALGGGVIAQPGRKSAPVGEGKTTHP